MRGRLIVSVILLIFAFYKVLHIQDSDFTQDYAAARGWWLGLDSNARTVTLLQACCPDVKAPFAILQTAHPPLATLVILPLALLPWGPARLFWLLLGWGFIVWSWHAHRIHPTICAATAALWLTSLSLGAFEPLLFFLITIALLVLRRAPLWAGALIGIAAAIKTYPAVLIVGLWLSGRRRAAGVAVLVLACASLLAELVLGHHATTAWLRYTPVNTLLQVDKWHNLSLVRILRLILPGTSPLLAAIALCILLTVPLIRVLRHSDGIRPMLPVMLLASPICWDHYLVFLGLGSPNRLEQICLVISSLFIVIVWMNFIPGDNLAPLGYGPLLIVLLLTWYRHFRDSRRIREPGVRSQEPGRAASTSAIEHR